MGRPPKPTKVLQLTGATKHDKKRYAARGKEPETTGPIGAPPEHWKKPSSYPKGALEEIWNDIVRQAPPGLLTLSDRMLLEFLCVDIYEGRRVGSKGAARARENAEKRLAKLGMDPASRARMAIAGQASDEQLGKLAEFQQRKKAG